MSETLSLGSGQGKSPSLDSGYERSPSLDSGHEKSPSLDSETAVNTSVYAKRRLLPPIVSDSNLALFLQVFDVPLYCSLAGFWHVN